MLKNCLFCSRESQALSFEMSERLFSEPHETAGLGICTQCGQRYLRYFVEYRDDPLDYFCQVTEGQWRSLLMSNNEAALRKEVVALLRSQEVFFSAPWVKEWASGSRVLVQPRPW